MCEEAEYMEAEVKWHFVNAFIQFVLQCRECVCVLGMGGLSRNQTPNPVTSVHLF